MSPLSGRKYKAGCNSSGSQGIIMLFVSRNAVLPRLEKGDVEIAYGFADESSHGSRADLDAIFKRMNAQTRRS